MNDPKVLGPVTLEAKIHVINPETGDMGVVTYNFSPGQPVTEESIEESMQAANDAVVEHGMLLMAPYTFFNHVLVKEKTGRVGNFAVPNSFHYDAFGLKTGDAPVQDCNDDECDEEYDDDY